ncbi:MAG TPA: response regulator transcription factor [Gammaproteobacteria bacterium]|nr:response regulator transcription factor [Gammaproteobacteria bacterium]
MRALVIEDEAPLRQQLEERLRDAGYAVDSASDGEAGLYFGEEYPIDVAVVDLGLPKRSGIDVIRSWRAGGRSFPVLILTARGRWQDKVDGLEAGADDYLVKPFHMEELLARLRALVRRASGLSRNVLKCGPVTLDTGSRSVEAEGSPVELTAFEYKVLEYLMLNAGKVVPKGELVEHVYDEDLDPDSNVLEVLVGRLRRKLDPERNLNPIETRRGQGYRFRFDHEV